jgi:hypothetical protein
MYFMPYIPIVTAFLERTSANTDTRFGVINNQQLLSPTTTIHDNNATPPHHHHQQNTMPLHHHHPRQPLNAASSRPCNNATSPAQEVNERPREGAT